MDTEIARTFLAVADSERFFFSADRLHVTQSTDSAGIRTLENQFEVALFVRNRTGPS